MLRLYFLMWIFIDHEALAKQRDNRIGSVRLSICLSVCALQAKLFDLSALRAHTDGQTDGRTDATNSINSLALWSIKKYLCFV